MIIDRLLDSVMDKYGIEKEDIDKVKKIIRKVKFTKIDGQDFMVIDIGDGVELSIKQ
jgi:hypothetical protein|tara:strand:- start:866 stop:1036 length:171 start_codon:yes stop_codon:yes gene_type:complete